MSENTCAFTGHRPSGLPFGYNENDKKCIRLKKRLCDTIEDLILNHGITHFISGMALGVDTYAAEAVLVLRKKYPKITLEAAIPCQNQDMKWRAADKERYAKLLSLCDKQTLISKYYTASCMHQRNRYMVDSASVLVAIWNGGAGGTGSTVSYAMSKNVRVVVINPEEL